MLAIPTLSHLPCLTLSLCHPNKDQSMSMMAVRNLYFITQNAISWGLSVDEFGTLLLFCIGSGWCGTEQVGVICVSHG